MDKDKEYYREVMALEWAAVLRFLVLSVPLSITSGAAWWAFNEDVPAFVRVALGLAAGMSWYLLFRHFFACFSAFRALEMMFEHWGNDQDVARVVRLGIGNQSDNRVQVVQPERVVPVTSARGVVRTIGGFEVGDLAYFVDRSFSLGKFGTSQRNWLGEKLRSGRVVESVEDWRALLDVFARVGILVNVGVEREGARWVVHDPQVVKDSLGLPVGSVLSVGDLASV